MSDSDSPSVIAACIQRFRYGAPSPSESRSHISAGKFWWLDSPTQNEVSNADRVTVDLEGKEGNMDSDRTAPATSKRDPPLRGQFADHPGFDSDIPLQRIQVPVRSEMFKYDAGEDRRRAMPRREEGGDDLDVVLSLDSYAERLLMKCDLLLKGYSSTATDKHSIIDKQLAGREVSRQESVSGRDSRGKSSLAPSAGTRGLGSNRLGSHLEGRVTSVSQDILNSDSDSDEEDDNDENEEQDSSDSSVGSRSHNPLSPLSPFPLADIDRDLEASSRSHLFEISQSTADLLLSPFPVGLSLAMSNDSWSDLMQQRGVQTTDDTPHVTFNIISDDAVEVPLEVPSTESTPSPTPLPELKYRAAVDSSDVSVRSSSGASHPKVEVVGLNADSIHIERNDSSKADENDYDDHENGIDKVPEPPCPSSSSPRQGGARARARGERGEVSLYLSSSSEMDMTVRATNRRHRENRENRGEKENSGDGADGEFTDGIDSSHRASSRDNIVCDLEGGADDDGRHLADMGHDSTDIVDYIDIHGDDCRESLSSAISTSLCPPAPRTHTAQTAVRESQPPKIPALDPPPPPLSEGDVSPYLEDEITRSLWARLCYVRALVAQGGQQGAE